MLKRLTTAAALTLVLGACASGPPPPPPPPDPTGTYDLFIDFQGDELPVVLTIRGSADAGYTGGVDSEMGAASLSNVQVAGEAITFRIPDADVSVRLTLNGDEVTGSMEGGMGSATVYGTKRSG